MAVSSVAIAAAEDRGGRGGAEAGRPAHRDDLDTRSPSLDDGALVGRLARTPSSAHDQERGLTGGGGGGGGGGGRVAAAYRSGCDRLGLVIGELRAGPDGGDQRELALFQ